MKSAHALILASLLLAASMTVPTASAADPQTWLTRCNREMGGNNDLETARYLFQTLGPAEGAQGRAELDYTAKGSATATIYPTAARDLMNPYSGASLAVGYYGVVESAAPYGSSPKVGHVSLGAIAKDFKPIPGAVQMKLVIDGKTFGPYEPKASSLGFGQYSVWLDTADTDGDNKPPILAPADFTALANAIDAMKAAEVVLVKDGADVARMPVSLKLFAQWRDALPKWASDTRPRIKAITSCAGNDKVVN